MDDEHCMKLEPNRGSRLNVADSRKEQCGKALAIRQAFSNSGPNLLEKLCPRCVFDQANEWLDRRIKPHDAGIEPDLRG
jgi:hypothetical protein